MKLVFATHNANKFEEIKSMLPAHIELLSLNDIGCTEDIPETADTIEENAILKAEYVSSNYSYDCFADDTGLEVHILDGEPGVYSARYAGEQKSSEDNIDKLLENLQDKQDRSARFITVIALHLKNHQNLFTGICPGYIAEKRSGDKGFGYDSIFIPENYNRTFAEMELSEKAEIGHRGKAFKALIQYLEN
ncbi:non-canonical purine NTP diphosphatase [Gramella sp. AN32]|uniref:dITP/XTP pyrophosphatase n=1 Tax=Christiangramia antarctica TaxID=2058158 RepID=A0ABW5XD42_9FLAO|nr:non-canonical purine NTP diphosphatase [Gramella sp. AN32]MCM4156490.1 non-canonical purine NTP pyrophosphatase [Gramella sp. AN32]